MARPKMIILDNNTAYLPGTKTAITITNKDLVADKSICKQSIGISRGWACPIPTHKENIQTDSSLSVQDRLREKKPPAYQTSRSANTNTLVKLHNLKHAICGAHILRKLQGLVDIGSTKWAMVFKSFLLSVYKLPFEEMVKRRQLIESRYDRICGLGEMAEPPPVKTIGRRGRLKRTK